MSITKQQLVQIIEEEIANVLREAAQAFDFKKHQLDVLKDTTDDEASKGPAGLTGRERMVRDSGGAMNKQDLEDIRDKEAGRGKVFKTLSKVHSQKIRGPGQSKLSFDKVQESEKETETEEAKSGRYREDAESEEKAPPRGREKESGKGYGKIPPSEREKYDLPPPEGRKPAFREGLSTETTKQLFSNMKTTKMLFENWRNFITEVSDAPGFGELPAWTGEDEPAPVPGSIDYVSPAPEEDLTSLEREGTEEEEAALMSLLPQEMSMITPEQLKVLLSTPAPKEHED